MAAGRPKVSQTRWWTMLPDERIECRLCPRFCKLNEGQRGFCFVRQRVGDRMVLTTYGRSSGFCVDPIEKKPVVHYNPGSKIFSIATTGCNWGCSYCQNAEISQRRKPEGIDVEPSGIVEMAKAHGCEGLAYTYNQPTIFIEYARDVGIEARKNGLMNIFVSNGYDTPDAVGLMNDFLDCITIDFKGNAETNFLRKHVMVPDAQPIYQTTSHPSDRPHTSVGAEAPWDSSRGWGCSPRTCCWEPWRSVEAPRVAVTRPA